MIQKLKEQGITMVIAFILGFAVAFITLRPKPPSKGEADKQVSQKIENLDKIIQEIQNKPIVRNPRPPNLTMEQKAQLWEKRLNAK